ncbi:unnamed protein product, partial [Iphiclides podalirius]
MERASRVQLQQHTNGAQSSVDRGLESGAPGLGGARGSRQVGPRQLGSRQVGPRQVGPRPEATRSTNLGTNMTKARYKTGDPGSLP